MLCHVLLALQELVHTCMCPFIHVGSSICTYICDMFRVSVGMFVHVLSVCAYMYYIADDLGAPVCVYVCV